MEPSIPRRSRKRRTPHRTSTAEDKNGGGNRRRTILEKDEHGRGRARQTCTAVSLEQSTVMDSDTPYLPEEIFKNILKRLPVKSLLRFQCVCKDWKNLFKTPSFIAEHHRHSTQQDPVLLFKNRGCTCYRECLCLCLINRDMQVVEYQSRENQFPSLVRGCNIVGSSNGLLCLVNEYSFILWNPATREVLQVPKVPNLKICKVGFGLKICYVEGFGFSPIVNDYKIVIIDYFSRLHGVYLVQVFSVSTWSWKEVGELMPGIMPYHTPGFTHDGAIFLWGRRGEGRESCLISFDIATESLALIPIPRSAHVTIVSTLTTYENKLAFLSKSEVECKSGIESTESFSINLWVMEKYVDASGERWIWTKIYTSNPFPNPGHAYFSFRPLTLWRNEIVIDGYTEGKTVCVLCNLHSNEVKMLLTSKYLYSIGPVIWNYAESLVSVSDVHVEASSS